jgi:putative ABC transport system permease protein
VRISPFRSALELGLASAMFRNYLTIAYRSLRRRSGYAALNLTGLAVGMACCLLIGLYVQNELSYDRFHPDSDLTVRVVQQSDDGGLALFGDAVVPILQTEIPQVEQVVQVKRSYDPERVRRAEGTDVRRFEETGFAFADTTFFDVFGGFSLQRGDPATALSQPGTVILTPKAARRYFGNEDPMGKTLIREDANDQVLEVTGILAPIPANSHLQFELLTNFTTFFTGEGYPAGTQSTSFYFPGAWTYARLQPGADRAAVEQQVSEAVASQRRPEVAAKYTATLQPLTSIHLHSILTNDPRGQGSILQVYVFSAIALFVLLIAAVNFINLSTARATERATEVGVRKSVGAQRGQVIRQFLGESVLLSVGAAAIALALTHLALPVLETILGNTFAVGFWTNGWLWLGVLGAVVVTGLGAGSYPAFVLSGFKPAVVVKNAMTGGRSRDVWLRKGLVVVQFTISVAMIVATAVAYSQLEYLRTARLGFDQEQIVTMETEGNYPALKQQLTQLPEVTEVSAASMTPGLGRVGRFGGIQFEINDRPPNDPEERLAVQLVDFGFFETMGVETLEGRTLSTDRRSDLGVAGQSDNHFNPYYRDQALVINRAMLDRFDWTPEEAIGQDIRLYGAEGETIYTDFQGEVVGVVENYHTASLRDKIRPVVYVPAVQPTPDGKSVRYDQAKNILVKVAPGSAGAVMDALRSAWEDVLPTEPFDATFLNDQIQAQYENERRLGQIVGVFSGLAILVACLGLFGLATYTTQQRTKEIGIRKAVGASVASIVGLLSKDFLKLVVVAVAVGVPVAYYAMHQWLTDFAYRVDLGPGPFVGAAGAALAIAAVTVSYHAYRAARTDPTRALRSE